MATFHGLKLVELISEPLGVLAKNREGSVSGNVVWSGHDLGLDILHGGIELALHLALCSRHLEEKGKDSSIDGSVGLAKSSGKAVDAEVAQETVEVPPYDDGKDGSTSWWSDKWIS